MNYKKFEQWGDSHRKRVFEEVNSRPQNCRSLIEIKNPLNNGRTIYCKKLNDIDKTIFVAPCLLGGVDKEIAKHMKRGICNN